MTRLALVTGVTGYVGARLVPSLLAEGWRVRVLVRDATRLRDEPWIDDVDVVEGELGDDSAVTAALAGTDVAYFLVHSMARTRDYARVDRELATAFVEAAGSAGTQRIVYLGGLYPAGERLSEHLESRREVGQILLEGPVPTAALQAGMVIGRGSASFDMLRTAALQPAIVAPLWMTNLVQPIAIDDVLRYLVGAASLPPTVNRAFDIGGPEAVSYRDLVAACAQAIGRPVPPMALVPVLLPRTASLWLGLVAPGSSSLNAALIHSLTFDMVCGEHDVAEHIADPEGGLTTVADAMTDAVRR